MSRLIIKLTPEAYEARLKKLTAMVTSYEKLISDPDYISDQEKEYYQDRLSATHDEINRLEILQK
jgi:hypothetical protein